MSTLKKNKLFINAFIIIFIFVLLLYISLDNNWKEFLKNINVELFGFLFDIALFGIILTWYKEKKDKDKKVENYLDEIEDYRDWKEKEASYRIFGIIKRLHKLEVKNIDLTDCYFEDINFSKRNITQGFHFKESILRRTYFKKCKFQTVDFTNVQYSNSKNSSWSNYWNRGSGFTEFHNSEFNHCNFNNSFMSYKFNNCTFTNINFSDAEFKNTLFIDCTFTDANTDNIKEFIE